MIARGVRLMLAMLALISVAAPPAQAQDKLPPAPYAYTQLPDPAQEAQARALMLELRCLVCQGQTLADSDAPMAGDMRHIVRTQIAAGKTPDQVRAWMIDRYGSWVTFDPPVSGPDGWVLALLPLLVLAAGVAMAWRRLRGRSGAEQGDAA